MPSAQCQSPETQEVHVIVRDLMTTIPVGIHAHEQGMSQRVCLNVDLFGTIPLQPSSIADCIDYDHIHALVVTQWPNRPHTPLLETLLLELIDFCFHNDARITKITASITKPDIFHEASRVGVAFTKTRQRWEEERRNRIG
jgi:dihydroneopterin aldolase